MSRGYVALSLPPKFNELLLLAMNKVCVCWRERTAATGSRAHKSESANVALENGNRGEHYCGRESIDATHENENRENCCCGRTNKSLAGVGVGATARMMLMKGQLLLQR